MTYELLSNRNLSEGFHVIFVYANDITGGLFFRLVLFAFFMICSVGGYFASKAAIGSEAKFKRFFLVGSLLTSLVAILAVSTIEGLDDPYSIIVCIAILAVASIWNFVDRE